MFQYTNYRPQAKFRKVMFLHMSVCPQRGGIPACIADGIPACLAAALQGVVSQHALQVSRPTPQGEVGGLARGGLQAHTRGGPTTGGSPGPHLGEWSPGPHLGGVSQHALRQTPHPHDGYCCRRYASYWNAFLFQMRNHEGTNPTM